MKIVSSENTNKKKFQDLDYGQVFFFGNQYFMKTTKGYNLNNMSVNAVYLNDGHFANISPDTDVELIDCELIIN